MHAYYEKHVVCKNLPCLVSIVCSTSIVLTKQAYTIQEQRKIALPSTMVKAHLHNRLLHMCLCGTDCSKHFNTTFRHVAAPQQGSVDT
jgi:hypothetical protein